MPVSVRSMVEQWERRTRNASALSKSPVPRRSPATRARSPKNLRTIKIAPYANSFRDFQRTAAGNIATDPLTARPIPKHRAVYIDKVWYDARSLARWLLDSRAIPHTRKPVTNAQLRNVIQRAV